MKDFIEVTMSENGGQLLVSITSIAFVEQFGNSQSRIVFKEKIEIDKNVNAVIIVAQTYPTVKRLIEQAQK